MNEILSSKDIIQNNNSTQSSNQSSNISIKNKEGTKVLSIESKVNNFLIKRIPAKQYTPIKKCYNFRRPNLLSKFLSCQFAGFYVSSFFIISVPLAQHLAIHFLSQSEDVMKKLKEDERPHYTISILINYFLVIIAMILLVDCATSDPGTQRGFQINKQKFLKKNIFKVIKGNKYQLKYCTTCKIIRDVRTFHCKICGVCVEKHDHHCNYISNCVGINNYKIFFIFLSFLGVQTIFASIVCIHIFVKFSKFMDDVFIFSLLLIYSAVFCGFFLIFSLFLIGQHITIICNNRTTREYIKNKDVDSFNLGCYENCKEAFCNNEYK